MIDNAAAAMRTARISEPDGGSRARASKMRTVPIGQLLGLCVVFVGRLRARQPGWHNIIEPRQNKQTALWTIHYAHFTMVASAAKRDAAYERV